jgi:sRNA-binding protein
MSPSAEASSRKKPAFVEIVEGLLADGLELPATIAAALAGDCRPLALSTRSDLPIWCELRGYDAAQTAALGKAIGRLTHWHRYIKAVAADGAVRVDLDGNPAESVSETDRHSDALATRSARPEPRNVAHKPAEKPLEARQKTAEPAKQGCQDFESLFKRSAARGCCDPFDEAQLLGRAQPRDEA